MQLVARPLRKARTVNATDTSFPAKVITATKPLGTGATATAASVIDMTDEMGGGLVPGCLKVFPYGVADSDDVFDFKIVGWRRILLPSGLIYWMPEVLAFLTATIGTAAGPGGGLLTTELFADTLTIPAGGEPTVTADVTRSGTLELFTPADNTYAWASIKLRGVEMWEAIFDMTTGAPTNGNLLYSYHS